MCDRQTKFEALKASLIEADEEIARGERITFDVQEILAEGRRIYAQKHGS